MALEYTLYLDTDWSSMRLYEVVSSCIRVEDVTEPDILTFSGEGLWGGTYAPSDATRKFVGEDFSFDPRKQISFRLDKFDIARAERSLIRCVTGVLGDCPDDALLFWNGETIVLQRRDGDLVLNERFGLWNPAYPYLRLVTLPYRMASI